MPEGQSPSRRRQEAIMSTFVIGVIVGFAAVCGVAVGMQAISPPREPSTALAGCELVDLARAGQLFRISSQDDWISARGDVYNLSRCPMLRDRLAVQTS
jgi:hypothetical protein